MYLSVLAILLLNSTIYQAILAMVNGTTLLKTLTDLLAAAIDRQRQLITGYAQEKRNKRIAMIQLAMKVKGGVQAYAEDNSLPVLFDSVDFEESILLSGRAIYSRSACQTIHSEAAGIIANLADYGIVAQDLIDLQVLITAFAGVISMPKAKKAELVTATEEIVTIMKKIDTLLKKKLDKQMLIFKNDPATSQFWNDYDNSRAINDPKTSFTEIKALILNSETNQPMSNVKMIASGEHNTFEEISNDAGIADKKQISPEITNLLFEIPGFESYSTTVDPNPGEKEVLTIKMKPL
jgi:hypothetical protein